MNILVLCTGNSCRSQMAEGWLKHFTSKFNDVQIYSAGIETHGLNPGAVATMQRVGIDISGQQSTHVDAYAHVEFDYVFTVCDHANEQCPVFHGNAIRFHNNFTDPSKLQGSPEEIRLAFDRTRDEIKNYFQEFVEQVLMGAKS